MSLRRSDQTSQFHLRQSFVHFVAAMLLRALLGLVALAFATTMPVPYSSAFAMPAPHSTAIAMNRQAPSGLSEQVDRWAAELSRNKTFANWDKADKDIQPIGPGTHGWLVVLRKDGKPLGYMVVNAKDDGTYFLGEYGVGPDFLFSETTLRRSLLENSLAADESGQPLSVTVTRHYVHPLAAVWEVKVGAETYLFDAKTGEQIPFPDDSWNRQLTQIAPLPPTLPATTQLAESSLRDTFDPYERLPWLLGEKPFPTQDEMKMQSRLRSDLHLRFVSEPFGDVMLYALPVVGFQRWTSGRLDLALDMEGTRFVPLATLSSFGLFYR